MVVLRVAYGVFFVVPRVERATRGIVLAQYEWGGRKKAANLILKYAGPVQYIYELYRTSESHNLGNVDKTGWFR